MEDKKIATSVVALQHEATVEKIVEEKLNDALIPGYLSEFDPEEALCAGAFDEDALSEKDAVESCIDLGEVVGDKEGKDERQERK
jgi:hypothetical protein